MNWQVLCLNMAWPTPHPESHTCQGVLQSSPAWPARERDPHVCPMGTVTWPGLLPVSVVELTSWGCLIRRVPQAPHQTSFQSPISRTPVGVWLSLIGQTQVLTFPGNDCGLARAANTHSGSLQWVLQHRPTWPTPRPCSPVHQQVLQLISACHTSILALVSTSRSWSLSQSGTCPDPAHMHTKGCSSHAQPGPWPFPAVAFISGKSIRAWASPQLPHYVAPNHSSCTCWLH